LAKPVVATDYSGNKDFLNAETGYPVVYKVVRLQKDHGPYPKGAQWAEPDVEEAARQLRFIFENRKEAEQKSRKGSVFIQNHFSAQAVSEIYRRRLSVLRTRTPRNV
jgi:glycosyltransferase involved in cell wall biosynthesis